MQLFNKSSKRSFGLICFCTLDLYILVISIFILKGYPIFEFIFCFPVIAFEMVLQYICIWIPKRNCGTRYLIFNLVTAVIMNAIFFGVYFGIFNQTMQYHLQDAQDCKVIGRQNTQIVYSYTDTELYSTLYINFTLDGEQYLGYGCLSSRFNDYPPKFFGDPAPYNFLYYGEKLQTSPTTVYEYNEVKLPSWMCFPFDIDYEYLINLNKCYINFFNNGSYDKYGPAYKNSRNRNEINKQQSFALTTFSKITVPYDQYFCLLLMTFCPIFPAISVIFFLPIEKLDSYIRNIVQEQQNDID